jgi:hypothetical protein
VSSVLLSFMIVDAESGGGGAVFALPNKFMFFLVAGAALPSYLVRERVDFRVQRTCEGEANNAPCKATLISKPANGTIVLPLTCEGLERLALPVQHPVGAGRSTPAERMPGARKKQSRHLLTPWQSDWLGLALLGLHALSLLLRRATPIW